MRLTDEARERLEKGLEAAKNSGYVMAVVNNRDLRAALNDLDRYRERCEEAEDAAVEFQAERDTLREREGRLRGFIEKALNVPDEAKGVYIIKRPAHAVLAETRGYLTAALDTTEEG